MIRFGVIGTNWITEELIKAGRESQEFALTAVYSRTAERANEFADKLDISYRYTDLESMAESDEVDAVYIASPNSFHAEQAVMLMNNGKHVLCEKPIASNTTELNAMLAAARKNNVVLMEALKSMLLPNFRSVREHLHKLGRIRRYFASYCQYSSRYDKYKQGTVLNAFKPAFSNGSLMDLGVYCLYPAVVLFGKPDAVKAGGVLLESGVDGEGSIILQYNDMDAVILHSKISSSYLPVEIQGEDATLVMDKVSQPEKVEIRYRDGRVEDITRPHTQHTMYYEVKEFIDLIKKGVSESAINSHHNSLITVGIMDEARRQMGLVYPADKR